MEKIRLLIRPDEFASLKVVKSTLEFIRFEGDLGDRSRLQRVLARLDAQRLNLAGFPNVLKVKAAEVKDDFPSRHSWDSYFRDAKHMNELKAGERPDTIHICGLPVKWFSEDDGKTPSEPMITKVFKRWGTIRRVDVPAADPYRSRMRLGTSIQKFSYEDGIFFDAYIQYVEYMDFVKAMDALRGMKLLKKDKEKNHLVASVEVDFDKTKHMSDSSVSNRDFERKRLIAQDNMAAEKLRRKEEAEAKKREEMRKKEEADLKSKESRRRTREEKRKRKALTVFRKQEEDKVSLKIAREERKLIKAQRQLESIRLLDALFDRIKIKVEKNEIDIKSKTVDDKKDEKPEEKIDGDSKENVNDSKKKDKKDKKTKKKKKEKKKKKLKTSDKKSEDSESNKKKLKSITGKAVKNSSKDSQLPYSADVYSGLPPQAWYYNNPVPLLYQPVRGFSRGRGRGGGRGRGRYRKADSYQHYDPQEYNEQYYKYFASLVGQDYREFLGSDREYSRSRSRSRTRRRSRSRKRHSSRSKSRSRKTTNTTSKIRTKSRSKTRSRSRSRGRSRSRQRNTRRPHKRRRDSSNIRVTRAKSRTTSSNGRKSRSSSWSLPKSSERRRSCSWSKNVDKKTDKAGEEQSHTPPLKLIDTIENNSVKPGKC
ncbi:A-kinase anchor protein 17A isoform X2 [Phymastichus coffea]|nr:A-kinase anchor protein 17A isoform X2 [Phymastichus coffea]XP_058803904.1 A-kinase anchor protein 17A isoform X2 [Phymastichus coffea]XP_058803905.1 A-kinase anchor protein 17A isoform X2 [Phymastichus coffea]